MTALPFKGGGVEREEGRQGPAASRSPLCVERAKSLSVRVCRINSNEHSAKRYARSGPDQVLTPERRDEPGASSSQQSTEEKQRGDVKRAGGE